MIKLYFKQAWTMVKQHPTYAAIYMIGTGLAVAMVLTVFLIYYVRFASVYPEYNRNRTLVIKSMMEQKGEENFSSSAVSYDFAQKVLKPLKNKQAVALSAMNDFDSPKWASRGKGVSEMVKPAYVNSDFFKVFTFRFVDGQPFDDSEVELKARKAVLSQTLAKQLFGSVDVAGQTFDFDAETYQVMGVVEDVSQLTPVSYADLWVPLTLYPNYDMSRSSCDEAIVKPRGLLNTYILVKDEAQKQACRDELNEAVRRLNVPMKKSGWQINMQGQPDEYITSTFRVWSNEAPDLTSICKEILLMLLALLLVPAMNLSGLISSKMEARKEEIGVRKAFGATRGTLINQVLWENLLFTLLGGALGLLLAYLLVCLGSDWVWTMMNERGGEVHNTVSVEMLFNPAVIGFALLLCFIINLVSALVPVTWALRHSIVDSLNAKK